jgi:replication factor A1
LIKEGCVYNLDGFWVKKSNDNYKPVTNHIMLTLSTWTTIEEVVEIPPAFPCLTYSLTPIEELPSRQGYTEYFIGNILYSYS